MPLVAVDELVATITRGRQGFRVELPPRADGSARAWAHEAHEMHAHSWQVIDSGTSGGVPLMTGDLVRLGYSTLRVRQLGMPGQHEQVDLCLDKSRKVCERLAPAGGEESRHLVLDTHRSQPSCRICLDGEDDDEDPLIAPCVCKGSVEAVHLSCLRRWLCGRSPFPSAVGQPFVQPFKYCVPRCELCKTAYPTDVRCGPDAGRLEPLVAAPNLVKPPFAVLEDLTPGYQCLHVIPLAGNAVGVTLGRTRDAAVHIEHNTVSRTHATVRFEPALDGGGKFLLEDERSKFGTAISARGVRFLNQRTPVTLQVGLNVVTLHCLSS